MRESVFEIGIGLRGIAVDEETNAIHITEFAQSGNPSLKALAKLFKISSKVANAKGSSDKAERKKGFKLKAKKFSAYALPNSIQVLYDFEDDIPDLLDSRMDVLRDVLDRQFAGIETSVFELNTKKQSVNRSYEASGFSNPKDAYEMMRVFDDLIVREGLDEVPIKFPGLDKTRKINFQATPGRPEFEPDDRDLYWERYEIIGGLNKDRSILVVSESGKGEKKIVLTAEQFAFFCDKCFSFKAYELYNFTVKQIKPKLFKLLDAKSASAQIGLDI